MEKRGRSCLRGRSKFKSNHRRAQVTLFIIVGIVILFTFLGVIMLTSQVQKSALKGEQEKIFTQAFNKEGMRLFVGDCLQDELEQGLILLGKQGRIWVGQPGGRKEFLAGETGFSVGETNIFYGITREGVPKYKEHPEAYPCDDENNPPSFCHYLYPETEVGFGRLELRSSTMPSGALTEDLRRYLINRTIWCVEDFVKTNLSRQARIEPTEMKMELKILNDGISVKVDYPLKFMAAGEEFFHLTDFDFFYPTKFKQFLDAAVVYPFLYDQKYVDFNYSEPNLKGPVFTYGSRRNYTNCREGERNYLCSASLFPNQYNSLGIAMDKVALPSGDDLFTFTSAQILNRPVDHSEEYEFRIARQNRPPALDYVSRYPCDEKGYDYLVIQGDALGGEINFNASARDPDEDQVGYVFSEVSLALNDLVRMAGANFQVSMADLNGILPNIYSVLVKAVDEHGLSDRQKVRILVDRPLETQMDFWLPYQVTSSLEDESGRYYFASIEDPAFIKVSFPTGSLAGFIPKINLSYINDINNENTESFSYDLLEMRREHSISGQQFCFSFPWKGLSDCSLSDYTPVDIFNWKDLQDTEDDFNFFQQLTNNGKLKLDLNINYCGGVFNKSDSLEATVIVKECVASQEPRHPWPFPYHNYIYELKADGSTDFAHWRIEQNNNPFNTTHQCCSGLPNLPGRWKVVEANEAKVCFVNPQPGCYGQITDYTALSGNRGYILEKQVRYCDGNRGNLCEGIFKNEYYNPQTNETGDLMYCGTNGHCTGSRCTGDLECSGIHSQCSGQVAFGLVGNNQPARSNQQKGWCYGKMGCQKFCSTEIVYTGNLPGNYFGSAELNKEAQRLQADDNADLGFVCGCDNPSLRTGQLYKCDKNFDGTFGGACSRGTSCQES